MELDWKSLTEATSGAVGALVSTTVLYPLDTCKTKYQAEIRSYDDDGHGHPPKYRFVGILRVYRLFRLLFPFVPLFFDLRLVCVSILNKAIAVDFILFIQLRCERDRTSAIYFPREKLGKIYFMLMLSLI